MSKKKEDMAEPWPREPLIKRLYACRFMLQLNDVLTWSEANKVRQRIRDLEKKAEELE